MRGKMKVKPRQTASGHKPTISEVLAEYLRAEKSRLAPKTYARYADVIGLFTHSLNGYAASSLRQFERARFDKHFDAEGEQHREFCDIFGPEHILENVGEFLNYFMVRKVIVGTDTLRASGSVMKKLAKWLVEQVSLLKTPKIPASVAFLVPEPYPNRHAHASVRPRFAALVPGS